jgi:pyridoxamine 5'-phosphate oxidase
MENNPIEIFKQWFQKEQALSKVRIPSACCLSTIGLDGYPNARFVSLKDILNDYFIITGTLTSRKGIEINNDVKVALTFWWTETEKQVRLQGNATKITEQLSDNYFSERNRDSQLVSKVSNQGEELHSVEELINAYEEIELKNKNKQLPRPNNWGGYRIEPVRIEFLEFKETRFHERKLYEKQNGDWKLTQLQP